MSIVESIVQGGVGGIFSGVRDLISTVAGAITGKTPLTSEQQAALLSQAADLQAKAAAAESSLMQAQIDVAKIDAASNDPYQRRARPTILWICALGLFYQFIVQPIFPWIVKVIAVATKHSADIIPALPVLDSNTLLPLLLGMLGLGMMRTVEKLNGKA